MKKVLVIFLTLFAQIIYSQTVSDNFKIGEYVEVFDNDSISVYFSCTGAIVNKECALFVRKGKIDSINCNVSGEFYDLDLEGNLVLQAIMINDYLNGKATYYFKNGNVKATGRYLNNKKNGVWTFYYSNGQLEKILNFVNGFPLIAEYYDKKGKQKVINGEGKYKGFYYTYKGCSPFTVKGKVLNGKMEGEWHLINSMSVGYNEYTDTYYLSNSSQSVGYEVFKEGKFVKGISGNYVYTDNQKIYINGYCVNEELVFYENSTTCPGSIGCFSLQYQGENLVNVFYPNLINLVSQTLNSSVKNQWLIVGLKINKENKLETVNIKSSINDNYVENQIFNILSEMNVWESERKNNEPVDSELFFSILIRNNQVIIPKEYLYRNK